MEAEAIAKNFEALDNSGVYLASSDKLGELSQLLETADSRETNILIEGSLLNDSNFVANFRKIVSDYSDSVKLSVRELLPSSMFKLMMSQNEKMKLDFLELFERNLQKVQELGIGKIIQNFDLLETIGDNKDFLDAIYGRCFMRRIELSLSLRIPLLNGKNLLYIHELIRHSMYNNLKLILDIHVDENGFLQMDFAEEIKPLLFDIGAVHFWCESRFGNRIEKSTIAEISEICRKFNRNLEVFV